MEKVKQNKLAVMPVNRLMLNMGIPMIISMMLQAVYNIVDSAFVANMQGTGEQALNALTLAFPVQMLMVAVGIGTGVGVNVLLSRTMGQGDLQQAKKISGNGVFLMAVIYIFFLLFGILGAEYYVKTQTTNPLIVRMATDYLRICCCYSFGILFFSLYEKVLQATGKSMYSTIAQITGAVVNVILDPIMIYGLFGCPKLGVSGAAYATVIGQIASALVGLALHVRANKEIRSSAEDLRPDRKIIRNVYSVGFAAIIAQALMSVMTYLLNIILVRVGENMVTAYGLYYKVQQFVLFAAFGLRDAIMPIVSFNYGMGNKDRIRQGIRYGMIYTLILMLAGLILLEIFAEPFAGLFGLAGETKMLYLGAMRIASLSFVFAGANIAFQGIFQALESGAESFMLSVCRQLLFVIPPAYGFCELARRGISTANPVWFCFLIAEVLTVLIAGFLMRRVYIGKILGKR